MQTRLKKKSIKYCSDALTYAITINNRAVCVKAACFNRTRFGRDGSDDQITPISSSTYSVADTPRLLASLLIAPSVTKNSCSLIKIPCVL